MTRGGVTEEGGAEHRRGEAYEYTREYRSTLVREYLGTRTRDERHAALDKCIRHLAGWARGTSVMLLAQVEHPEQVSCSETHPSSSDSESL